MIGDGHLACFCVVTWLFHFSILKGSAWKNVMEAMAKRQPWQRGALEKCHGTHGKKGRDTLKILSGPRGAAE